MNNGTKNYLIVDSCPCCGKPLPPRPKRGRPSLYCSRNCSNLRKFFTAFEKCLNAIDFNAANGKSWRSEMFAVANNIWIKKGGASS